jgi:hypothetical protein
MAASIPPQGKDCPQQLGLTNLKPGSFDSTETALTAAQAAVSAAWDIAQIAVTLITADGIFLPILPIVSLGFAIYEIADLFGSGRPKFQDTNDIIAAYEKSKYWPLHALASDMRIWVKNGAPISDSNPAVQATFSAAKLGTIESIQQLAGWQAGESSPGFWQLQRLINQSWVASKLGEPTVLKVVQAIDRYAEILACLKTQATLATPQPPPGGGGGGGGGRGGGFSPCDSGNPNQDEILDMCNALQGALANLSSGSGSQDECCSLMLLVLRNIKNWVKAIAIAAANYPPPAPPPDLSGIVNELAQIVAAVQAIQSAPPVDLAPLVNAVNQVAAAISGAPGIDVSGIVQQLAAIVREGDVKQPILDSLVAAGYMTGEDAQVLQGADWADSAVRIFRTALWTGWNWFLGVCGVDMSSGRPVLKPLGSTIADDLARMLNFALGAGAAPLYPEVKGIIDGVVAQLQPSALPSIGDVKVDADLLLAKTLSPLLIVNAVALVVDYFGWEISETLKQYTEWISEFVGLQEVRELKVGQMMRFGPMREAELRAKATYRQEIAGMGAMAQWSARGLYDPGRTRGLAPVLGIPIEQVQPAMEAAYRGLNARQMLRLIETGLYSQAEINDELTFSGMRPLSQRRMLLAAPYLATNSERNTLRSTLEKAYIAGLMDDATLTDNVNSIEQNTDRANLVLQRVKWEVLIQESKDLETEYTTMFVGNLIDDPTFRALLSGIGLQPWKVNTVAAKAEARANATLQRKTLAAAAALQKATATVERATALKNYEDGSLPLPLYTAALLGTGLTPTQAAAWSDLASLKKQGNVRWVYGLQLPPAAATILKQRVSALTDQRKRQLITQPQYVQGLTDLGLSNTWINGLDAAAEAMLTPKIAAFPVPVTTS